MKVKFNNKPSPLFNLVSACAFSLFLAACGSSSNNSSSSSGSSSSGSSSSSSSSGGSSSGAPPLADYGDAPDGGATGYPVPFAQNSTFPTLLASNGAHIIDVTAASLGVTNTEETDANVINDDIDDGVIGFATILTSIPPPTTMTVNVTGTEDGAYFLNSLIDLNMDGKWGDGTGANGEAEWVVQNLPVTITAGVVTPVTSPPFAFTNGLFVPTHAWIRVALTKEAVPQNWDGSGEFSKGEIEDHVISMPIINGKEVPMLSVNCGGPYKFNGAASIKVTCIVTNLRSVAGFFSHEVIHQPGGGTVDVRGCVPATPPNLAIGAAATPGVPPVPNPAAAVTIVCDAFKGQTRDVWTFKAKAIDPLFASSTLGFSIEHSETTSIEVEFLDDDPVPANDLFLTEFNVDDIGFTGQLGGTEGCFGAATVTVEVSSTPGSGGSYSEILLISPNDMGGFNSPFANLPFARPPGEYTTRPIDLTSPTDPGVCFGGGRYAPNLNEFSPNPSNTSLVPNNLFVTLFGGNVTHGIGMSFMNLVGTVATDGPPGCYPDQIQILSESTGNGIDFTNEQFTDIGIDGGGFTTIVTVPVFDTYQNRWILSSVPPSANCPFGAAPNPALDTAITPLNLGVF